MKVTADLIQSLVDTYNGMNSIFQLAMSRPLHLV